MDKPFIRGLGYQNWGWIKENPREIILAIFILIGFFFFYALPPQGWGIDSRNPIPITVQH